VSQTAQTSNSLGGSKKSNFCKMLATPTKYFFPFYLYLFSRPFLLIVLIFTGLSDRRLDYNASFYVKNQKIFPAVIFRDFFVEAECRERKDKGVKTIYSLFGGIDL
jgi:hypothetical protein